MTRPTDPAPEIKRALDREVERRFDARSLSAALEQAELDARGRRSHKSDRRSAGPFDRVPVPVQWIGVAAALIAAVAGVRSLYLDWTAGEPEPATTVVVEARRPADEPEIAPPPAREATERAGPVVPSSDDASGNVEEATGEAAPMTIGQQVLAAEGQATTPAPDERPGPEPAPPARDRVPRVATAPVLQESVDTKREEAGAQAQASSQVIAVSPAVAAPRESGVRVASLRLGGRALVAEIQEAPEVDATLVTIREPGEGTPRPRPPPTSAGKPALGARPPRRTTNLLRNLPASTTPGCW